MDAYGCHAHRTNTRAVASRATVAPRLPWGALANKELFPADRQRGRELETRMSSTIYDSLYIYIYHKKDRKGAGRVQSCKQSRNHDKHQTANSYVPTKCLMLLLTSPGQNWFEWNALCIGHLLAFVWKLGTNCRMRNFPLVPSGWEKLRPLP